MATEPQHSENMSGAPSSSEPADVSADAALILAALARMEAVVQGERAVLGSLRSALGDMAQALARAKAVADSEIAADMLDEFEHRIDAMLEIAGIGAPAPETAAVPDAEAKLAEPAPQPQAQTTEPMAGAATESDQVPTVSGVVLRLGPDEAAPERAMTDGPQPPDTATEKGPTVAMLTAMVEALSASIQQPAPEPPVEVAATAAEADSAPPVLATPVLETTQTLEVAAAAPEPVAPPAEPEPVLRPTDAAAVQETALLASFEQMEARPFPPPDEGTAVIFTTRPEPEPQPEPAPEPPAPPEPCVAPEPEQAATPQPVIEATPMAQPAAEPTPSTKPAFEAWQSAEPAPAQSPPAAEATAATTSVSDAEPPTAQAYFDPTDFLFGPEPEPDPAAFLLDPAPPRTAKAVVLPQPEFVPRPPPQEPEPPQAQPPEVEPPQAEEEPPAAASAEAGQPEQPTPEPAPHDPLRALKAMSPAERLAIFS
jgi:hypothetical protein